VGYFGVFVIYPIYKAFAGSLHDWNPLIDQYDFVGLANFKNVLTNQLFWSSISNTFIFAFFSVIFRIIIGLGLAILLYSKLARFKTFFRGMFYMPTITPLVAVSFVWMWLYNPQFGLINKVFHIDINWLKDSHWALPAIIIMTIWKDFGYATVIFLGGLMGLPEDVFEAADMDGASKWQRFVNITWPLLKPTTLFVTITSLISYLQAYVQILIMTEGGPGTSTYVISYLIFDEAFVKYNFGVASAMAIILFVIIGILTVIMFKITGESEGLA
jgi:multiple sugar transport system permease protein